MTKKMFSIVSILIIAAMVLASCAPAATPTEAPKQEAPKEEAKPAGVKVGLVTDVGKVNDGTFNQYAYEGAKKAAETAKVELNYIETTSSDDYMKNVDTFANEGYKHIVTVGFMMGDTTKAAAEKYPNINFSIVDFAYDPAIKNVQGLVFREDQAGFMAGVLAGQISKSKKVGIVAGMEIPPVKKYRNGYDAGVKYVCPDCSVIGVYIDSFTDPARGKAAAESQIAEGADVIFGAGGPTGSGGILGAAQQGAWVIGVDQDEYLTTFKNGAEKGADKLISSAMKRVDVAVETSVTASATGKFQGGTQMFDAKVNGVGLAPFHDAEKAVSAEIKAKMDETYKKLADGSLDTGVDPVTGDAKGGEQKPAEKPAATGAIKELKIIWAEWDPSNYLQQLVNDYEKEAGVKVTVVQEPWGSFADRVFTEFAGKGGSYDLVIGDSQWLGQGATQGHFVELTDIFDTELNGKALSQPTVQYYAEYPAGSKKYWAYPTEGDAIGWSYRKDLFEDPKEMEGFKAKYGYDLAVPQDLNQLRDIAEWFNRPDKNQYGIAVYTQKDYDGLAMGIEEVLWNFGGDWGNYATGQVKGIVNSEDSIKAVDFYKGLYQFAPPGSSNDFYAESLNHFTSGEVAMAMNYFAFFPGLVNEKTNKFAKTTGFFSNPKGPKGDFTSLGGQGMSIVSYISPERQAAAKDFLKWFAKTETQQKWADLGGYTCNADILKSEKFLANTPYNKAFSESMLKVKDFWNIPVYVELLNVAKVALHKFVVGGEGTAKEAMDAIAEAQDPILKDGGYQSEGAAAAPAEAGKALPADTYIPVISKGFQHQFWQAVKLGSEKAAAEFGVKITFEGPETEAMVDKQMEMLQTAIDKKPGAICFAAVDSKAAIPLLEKAKAAGIPVIGFDSGVDSDIPLSTAATDNIAAAAMAADKMAELIGGKGEVAIIAHDQTSRTGIDRVKGFTDEIKAKYPDITIVDTQYGGGDQLKSTDIAKAIISSKPNLKGFFGANEGSIIGVLNAVTELKMEGKIVVIGYDSGKQQIDAIKSGVEAGAITQDPIGIGYKCVEAAVKALKGEKLDKFINTGFHWFDKTNIDAADIKPLLYQ